MYMRNDTAQHSGYCMGAPFTAGVCVCTQGWGGHRCSVPVYVKKEILTTQGDTSEDYKQQLGCAPADAGSDDGWKWRGLGGQKTAPVGNLASAGILANDLVIGGGLCETDAECNPDPIPAITKWQDYPTFNASEKAKGLTQYWLDNAIPAIYHATGETTRSGRCVFVC